MHSQICPALCMVSLLNPSSPTRCPPREQHTIFRVKADSNIIMLRRIFRHVKTQIIPVLVSFTLRKRELGIHDPNVVSARSAEGLEYVGALQSEIHAGPLAEVLEEGHKLDHLVSFHDLNSCNAGFPPFVVHNRAAT